MIGVTIAVGEGWTEVAKHSMARMSHYTGLECRAITSMGDFGFEHPSWLKCKILDLFPNENEFFYFDADIWCMKLWSPKHLFQVSDRSFMAVKEPEHNAIDAECVRWAIPRQKYFNGGLLIFGREHEQIFKNALAYHPFGRWYEQTPLNIAAALAPTTILDLRFNTLSHGGNVNADSETVNLHWCSCGSAEKVRELQRL